MGNTYPKVKRLEAQKYWKPASSGRLRMFPLIFTTFQHAKQGSSYPLYLVKHHHGPRVGCINSRLICKKVQIFWKKKKTCHPSFTASQPTPPNIPPTRKKTFLRAYYPLVSVDEGLISWGSRLTSHQHGTIHRNVGGFGSRDSAGPPSLIQKNKSAFLP